MSIIDKRFLVGVFDDDHELLEALAKLQEEKIKVFDVYTPFPVHGIDDLLDIKRSRLPIITFIAAILGTAFALWVQYWTSSVDWAINVGGKPFNSIPAFIPVTFEIAILAGAFVTVFAFFIRTKIFPKNKFELPHKLNTDNKFVVAIEEVNSYLPVEKIESIFKTYHCNEIYMQEGSTWIKEL